MSAMEFGFVFKAWSFDYINTTLLLFSGVCVCVCVCEARDRESERAPSCVVHYQTVKQEVGKVRAYRRQAGGVGERLLPFPRLRCQRFTLSASQEGEPLASNCGGCYLKRKRMFTEEVSEAGEVRPASSSWAPTVITGGPGGLELGSSIHLLPALPPQGAHLVVMRWRCRPGMLSPVNTPMMRKPPTPFKGDEQRGLKDF